MDEGRKIFEWWKEQVEKIEQEAKANGTWKTNGLDGNQHLFKALEKETREKLSKLKK